MKTKTLISMRISNLFSWSNEHTSRYLRSWCLDDHACRDDDHLDVCGADVGISFLGPLNVAASMGRSGVEAYPKSKNEMAIV